MNYLHTPVMLAEVLYWLEPAPGKNYIDCTLGGGGMAAAIARLAGEGAVLAIDLDLTAIKHAEDEIKKNQLNNIILINDNFRNLKSIVSRLRATGGPAEFSGAILDLGLSSAQLADSTRGFSFAFDAPLNMSFAGHEEEGKTHQIINQWPRAELERIFRYYGEEPFARPMASAIIEERKKQAITTTGRLVAIIEETLPAVYQRKLKQRGLNPATRIFQALRIATNEELENLRLALPDLLTVLTPGARIAVISYHSLEDRLVKNFFRNEARAGEADGRPARLKVLTKKVLRPAEDEVRSNPRARSAKMRVAQII
jgi:16S rRNA (cytosine1402-N4)-methyltransferase